ncbi:unnamed protein product [Dovyalis caffra]|uniref:Uncharacterized protein n=1 Tax=Dovyalis caffra TaxID=77055 RepID=A0AAV1QZZ9_9ROSI|nr:unnamed protein product [Dovyalis caffra]
MVTTSPGLRRCSSDPFSSPPFYREPNVVTTPASKGSIASLPPRPTVRRSMSDLSPNNIYSRSSWLKRTRDSTKEINQLWDEIMPCEYEEDDEDTEENITNAVKDNSLRETQFRNIQVLLRIRGDVGQIGVQNIPRTWREAKAGARDKEA